MGCNQGSRSRTSDPSTFHLEVIGTNKSCPIGEKVAAQNMATRRTPVLSCEGACIRGEIARLAANRLAHRGPYRRACHGELFAVPDSTMHRWVRQAEKVVLIDGCFLRCHGRMIEPLVGKDRLVQFDALSHYKMYTDVFDIDAVPEEERKAVAEDVADWVLEALDSRDSQA